MARPLRCYIAASWTQRHRLRGVRDQLVELGLSVTSTWIDANHGYTDKPFPAEAGRDYRQIDKADFLILDTTDTESQGGRDWEAGYATGRGKRVLRVGPSITPFHTTVNLGFESWSACLGHLATALEHADVRNN